ncbi:MAG: glutamine--tRNA ligase/YqeY domain fusion protein [Cellvibrionales bacterium]|nr:glutamine--tRNA ligase/YqeY domain fusion protein [Cellvibrionales bacterium]
MSDEKLVSQSPSDNQNFIEALITEQQHSGELKGKVITRFPPEPNGFLHIGHAKSICLNFGLAEQFGGDCHLRFDDTNPAKEDQIYIDSIQEDVKWLGFDWSGEVRYASSYFDQFYAWAVNLIEQGLAYVCDLTPEEASEYRGWATKPGKPSPYRNRTVDENLALFEKMRAGEFDEGACVLRAKIDMASPNMNLRDPILYRIRKAHHHQTGDKWCIYPSYDFAHGQEDAIEGVTHSICTLEFQDHKPLYEWFIEQLPVPSKPKQYEFGRLHMNYTVMSKRKLKQLVDEKVVSGWDDPRLFTLSGLRRRGIRPEAIRTFCDGLAVAKTDGIVDIAQFEYAVRDDLNQHAYRAMCVLNPLKVTLTNIDDTQMLTLPHHPNEPSMGEREVPFTKEIYIDKADFSTDTTLGRKKFKRLVLGDYVRLRGAYVIQAKDIVTNDQGDITEVIAEIVEGSLGANPKPEQKPRGVIHWVSATDAVPCELRLYSSLFTEEFPEAGEGHFLEKANKDSLTVVKGFCEPALASAKAESNWQFEREGYFVADRYDHSQDTPVFNLTIDLKASR